VEEKGAQDTRPHLMRSDCRPVSSVSPAAMAVNPSGPMLLELCVGGTLVSLARLVPLIVPSRVVFTRQRMG
jgi:hypothetical protein